MQNQQIIRRIKACATSFLENKLYPILQKIHRCRKSGTFWPRRNSIRRTGPRNRIRPFWQIIKSPCNFILHSGIVRSCCVRKYISLQNLKISSCKSVMYVLLQSFFFFRLVFGDGIGSWITWKVGFGSGLKHSGSETHKKATLTRRRKIFLYFKRRSSLSDLDHG